MVCTRRVSCTRNHLSVLVCDVTSSYFFLLGFFFFFFFFNDPAPPEIYPLSLHDALPICSNCLRYRSIGTQSSRRIPSRQCYCALLPLLLRLLDQLRGRISPCPFDRIRRIPPCYGPAQRPPDPWNAGLQVGGRNLGRGRAWQRLRPTYDGHKIPRGSRFSVASHPAHPHALPPALRLLRDSPHGIVLQQPDLRRQSRSGYDGNQQPPVLCLGHLEPEYGDVLQRNQRRRHLDRKST